MRFCLSIPPFTDPAVVLGWARAAEAHGWDGFFLWDHLSWDGKVEVHDPWTLLGAVAVQTSRIRVGTMVTPISRRRPQVLAKQLMTLDHLSGGRVTLGVGLGDPPDLDFSDFGDEPSYVARAAITDQALDTLAALLAAEGTLRPAPVQSHLPIWIAGRAPHRKPLERARRWDGYVPISNEFLTPGALASYVGPHPHDAWDLVVQWPHGSSAEEYAAAGATWLVRSVWPQEEGWRDEVEALVSAPPA